MEYETYYHIVQVLLMFQTISVLIWLNPLRNIGWLVDILLTCAAQLYVLCKCCIPIFLVTWMPQHKIPAYTFITKWSVLWFQTASLLVVFPKVKMFVTGFVGVRYTFPTGVQRFYLVCFIWFVTVVFNICSRDFFWYKIDFIRLSFLSAGKLVFCQKTDTLFMFVLA